MDHEEYPTKSGDKETAPGSLRALGQSFAEGSSDLNQRRQTKIHEHLGAILDSSDTLQACMGSILCDTLEMCQTLKTALAEEIGDAPSPMVGVKHSMQLIQVYLQTVRQAERLANLDCRMRESRSSRPLEERK